MVDVVDPGGLVRSQVVESDDGAFRLTLNGAENRKTFAGRFIAESFGSSVQHLAFSCRDIFATAAQAQVERLPAARDLAQLLRRPRGQASAWNPTSSTVSGPTTSSTTATMRGEFFQLYSRSYGEGLFFEIVERRAGYRGYGAANAPFRIAAQKRGMAPAGMPRS